MMSAQGSRLLACVALALLAAAVQAQAAGAAVVLNEVNCEGTDWIELVNTSGAEADISGWLLTDDPVDADPPRVDHRLVFPNPTTIAANDDLVIEKGVGGFPFGVSCGNDTIRLADATPALVDDEFIPVLTLAGDTWGRYPNGTGEWTQTAPTEGAANVPSSGGGPGEDLAGWMFDPAVVVEIDLDLPQESIDALEVDPFTYQDGTFSLTTTGGSYGPLDVGVRLKGGIGSFRSLDGKAAFKVKFNHSVGGQRFLGLEKLTLNNMVQDESMIHEVLAYEAFRAAGVPAPRAGYAYVRVNGEDYGLHLNLETLDRVSLPRWFESTQHLYEGEYGDEPLPGRSSFEVDEGNESDLADLDALIEAAAPGPGWFERAGEVADLEQMTRMWAVERYIGHWDSYAGGYPDGLHPNNYYLHSDAAGRFTMLPWGTDQAWTRRMTFEGPGGHLFNSCLADQTCWVIYRDAVQEAASAIAGVDLDGLAASTAAGLGPSQAMDARREYSLEQIEAGVAATRALIAARRDDADDPAYWYDRAAPDTRLTRAPRRLIRTRRRRVRVSLDFDSTEPGARFECRLDDGPWTACDSPLELRVGRGLHLFWVRAVDAAGNADGSPEQHAWRVRRVRRPPTKNAVVHAPGRG